MSSRESVNQAKSLYIRKNVDIYGPVASERENSQSVYKESLSSWVNFDKGQFLRELSDSNLKFSPK